MSFLKTLLIAQILCGFLAQAEGFAKSSENKRATQLLKTLPVHDRGRVKPLDTFARESVEYIRGKSHAQSLNWLITWILVPEEWDNSSFILIRSAQVRKALELKEDQETFSPLEIIQNPNFQREVAELQSQKFKKQKLSSYFLEIEKLESRLGLYQAIRAGLLPLWLPQSPDKKANTQPWFSAAQLNVGSKKALIELLTTYLRLVSSQGSDTQSFEQAFKNFKSFSPENSWKIKAEIHYNSLNPFRWSWVFYFISLVLLVSLVLAPKYQFNLFLSASIIGFILNTYGIILRSFIMSRPPVSNMFETLIWVPWVAYLLALVFSKIRKDRFPLIIGAAASFFCLMLVDQAQGILNGKLEPLEAVLRSNFWLSTHVLIITMSYAAFLLAFCVGDYLVFQRLLGRSLQKFKTPFWFLRKCLQIGVSLLALGTILGAIWADYSWGRFWGWDPKEVWALVSLLTYLALLHARLQGWVKDFGMAIGSISCFFMVIMAWYGVNFVLGKGLHSYGFGQGGLPYVLAFVGAHLIFMFLAWRKGR